MDRDVSNLQSLIDRTGALLGEDDVWLPDLFACIYDLLSTDKLWRRVADTFITALRDPLILRDNEARFRAQFRQENTWCELESSPRLRDYTMRVLDAVADADPKESVATARLIELAYVARLIDAYMSGLSVHGGMSVPDRLQRYWDALSRSDSLTTAGIPGRVVPRVALPKYGNALPLFFAALTRVSARVDASASYQIIATGPVRDPKRKHLRVGFIPTVVKEDEVVWGIERPGADDLYTVNLCPNHEPVVMDRLVRALDWLDSQGVDLIVMPELTSSKRIRSAISRWLLRVRGPFLVVAGSEAVSAESPTGKTNRAYMLGARGRELWTQDKAHQYPLTDDVITQFNLRAIYSTPLNEVGSSFDDRIAIRDAPGIGRFAVLVCEDFQREKPGPDVIQEYGLNICITIVLSGYAPKGSWTHRTGINTVQSVGASVLVGNSYALLSRSKLQRPQTEDLAAYWLPNQVLTSWVSYCEPDCTDPLAYIGFVP